MTMIDQERELSTRLHAAAGELDVPSDLLLRVRETAEQQPPRANNGKRAVVHARSGRRRRGRRVRVFRGHPQKHLRTDRRATGSSHSAPASGHVWHQLGRRSATRRASVASSPDTGSPDLRGPLAVVTGYLTAARAGNRADAAATYWERPRDDGQRGDLCEDGLSDSDVSAHEGLSSCATSDVVAATLTTSGSSDEIVAPGRVVWFFQLERQSDGTWRISSGRSSP